MPQSPQDCPYVYLNKYDILLKVYAKEQTSPDTIEISKPEGRSFKRVELKVAPNLMQSAVAIKGVQRLALMKYGRIDAIDGDLYSGKKCGKTSLCLPLKRSSGKYDMIWIPRDSVDDRDIENYTCGSQLLSLIHI